MDVDGLIAAVRAALPGSLVALDFDGTLAPIVADPADSRPAPGAVRALTALAEAGAQVALITGRDARTVLRLGGLDAVPGLVVSGLYGAESWCGGELSAAEQPAVIAALRDRLPAAVAAGDPALWVEDKGLSLVVHARRAADPGAALDSVRPAVTAVAGELGLEVHDGRDVLEVRLAGYNKGTALRQLAERFGPSLVLFAGDDVGDLPAFAEIKALRAAGRQAWALAVVSDEVPGLADAADVRVDGPAAVVALLTAAGDRSG